jgi:hypothetical protein
MFKLLTYVVLGYLAYRVFFKRKRIPQEQQKTEYGKWKKADNSKRNNGEYIDYEEVD